MTFCIQEALQNGLNVHDGEITCRIVADALRLPYAAAGEVPV
jgi:alanine dehydrogenase